MNIYTSKVGLVLDNVSLIKKFHCDKISFYKMSNLKSIDLDTRYDFEIAKLFIKNFKKLNKYEKKN